MLNVQPQHVHSILINNNICAYIYVCVSIYICVYMCLCVCVCVCLKMVSICASFRAKLCVKRAPQHVHSILINNNLYIYICMHVYVHVYIYVHVCMYIYMHEYVCMYIYMHEYVCMCECKNSGYIFTFSCKIMR